MSKTPLRDDLIEALKHKPLTAIEAAAEVGTKVNYARKALDALCESGIVRRRGFSAPPHPATLFEFCQPQSEANP